jgi:hypothetical protein
MEAIKDKPRAVAGLRPLLASLIDYAGLFPPAGLAMDVAVSNYAQYRTEPYSWMLGRFVVPVERLAEFERAWVSVGRPSGWQLSALVARVESDLPLIVSFNTRHAGALQIDALEVKVASVQEIVELAGTLPRGIATYIEVSIAKDVAPLLAAIRANGLRAKIRTGGLTADLFPDAGSIARFLLAAANANVAFKATAGLHHPVRCERAFTYEPDSARGTMHGFLNVFLAAAFARAGQPADVLGQVLLETNPIAFHFDEQGLGWREERLSTAYLGESRAKFAIAFGSCSFEEPISDLQTLGLLP